NSFIVDIDLIDRAFIVIYGALDQAGNALCILQSRSLIQIRQIDKEHRHPPELSNPTALSGCQAINDRAGNVRSQRILSSLRDGRRCGHMENGRGFVQTLETSSLRDRALELK